jgi:hypothetical protein
MCEQGAHARRIVPRDGLLAFVVRRGDRLWDDWLVEHILEPIEERLVRVDRGISVRVDGGIAVEDERRPAACAVEDVRCRERHALCVLDIEVGFGAGGGRVAAAIVDFHNGVSRRKPIGPIFLHEQP